MVIDSFVDEVCVLSTLPQHDSDLDSFVDGFDSLYSCRNSRSPDWYALPTPKLGLLKKGLYGNPVDGFDSLYSCRNSSSPDWYALPTPKLGLLN